MVGIWAGVLALAGIILGTLVAQEPAAPRDVELEGKVVCLPERMHELYEAQLPTGHEHIYGFETTDGTFLTLLRTKFSEALFAEEEVRKKRLLLKGRVFPKSQVFEVMRIRSVKDGVVHDLFYYCTVCSIESVAPGICSCCQEPVELKEKPLPPGKASPPL